MKHFPNSAGFLIATFALAFLSAAIGQTNSADKAQSLLQEVKSQAASRQRDAQKREIERLQEDLEKGRKEAQEAQRSVDSLRAAVAESTERLGKLGAQKLQLTKTSEVVTLQLEAERLKVEGLKLLSDAQVKGALALAKRADETEVRTSIEQAKMDPNASAAAGDPNTSPAARADQELQRKLARSERAAATARSIARDAMKVATAKLQEASTADDKARQRAAELGVTGQFAPAPVQEMVEPLKEIEPDAGPVTTPSPE